MTVDDYANVGVDGSSTPYAAPDVAGSVRSPYRPPVGHIPNVSRFYLIRRKRIRKKGEKKTKRVWMESGERESRGRGK